MWLTKEMEEDINSKITYVPYASSWTQTLEYLSDALAEAGYKIEITKMS